MERPDSDDPKLTASLQHLHAAIGSAELIISNLLEISRLDTGSLKPKLTRFALNDVLEPLVHDFRVQTHTDVIFHYQRTSLWTESDARYLRRILQNFFSNAVKYTNKGKILIGCLRRGTQIKICVYDTGPGISETHQQRIFDDFYRVTTNVDGAGLGLGIALRFSHLLGHQINVQSSDSKGSLFSLLVPLCEKQITLQNSLQETKITSGLEDLAIFYVDDEENNIHALGTLMANWGCKFSSANNAATAEAYAKNNPAPDVLLMDYQLGTEVNGIQLADTLRNHWKNIPVCIVSAAPEEDLSSRVSNHGYDFLRKPIKPGKLRALLEKYLQRKNS